MKEPRNGALAAAALTLLGSAAPAVAEEDKRWLFDSAMLLYNEGGDRVFAFEPKVNATFDLLDGRQATAGFTVDVLTGSSPNGAAPAAQPQTFTSPSGETSFTTPAGELPLDPAFRDTRYAVDLAYVTPLGDASKAGIQGHYSTEFDYHSLGGGVTFSRDFNLRNTTLSAGLNYASDSMDPIGGVPTPLAVKTGAGGGAVTESKTVVDGLIGLTQVLSRESLLQVNYSASRSSGYHTDPFKIVSVVDASGAPLRYVFESRPDTRLKHAVFVQYKRFLWERDVMDVSYRFLTDDWGVVSHTVDASHRWNFASTQYLEPHLRWYRQSAADFYTAALDDGQETEVDHASADQRLGSFDGVTAGLKYGQSLRADIQWSARVEYYRQINHTDGLPPQAAAPLSRLELAPPLNALMVTLGFRFKY